MQQTEAFNFTQAPSGTADTRFKKQRQAYLAQRNARKLEAIKQIRQQAGDTSSSQDDQPSKLLKPKAVQVQPPSLIQIKVTQPEVAVSQTGPKDEFQKERQIYKETRVARRKEMMAQKKQEFGSSSQDQYFPTKHLKTQLKQNPSPKLNYLESPQNQSSFGSFDLNQLKPAKKYPAVRLKSQSPQKSSKIYRFQVQVPSQKGMDVWIQKTLQFKQLSIQLGETSIPIYSLNKCKLFFTKTPNGSLKFKLCKDKQEFMCAINHAKGGSLLLDSYYQIFARVVAMKIQMMGKTNITKKKQQVDLSEDVLKDATISGRVRKSSFFTGWEERIGVINASGLSIYKAGKNKPHLVIPYNSVKQLWTRFEFDEQNLIVKLFQGKEKIELSVPIDNFLTRNNWLYHIYSLAKK